MSRGNEGLPAFNSEDELDYLSGVWVSGIGRPAFGLFGSKHIAPLEQGEATVLSTNILPRWGRGIGVSGFYINTAPLGQADRDLWPLQTYCPAGGRGRFVRRRLVDYSVRPKLTMNATRFSGASNAEGGTFL